MRVFSFLSVFLFFYLKECVECIQLGTDVVDKRKYPFFIMIGSPHICGGALVSYDPAYVLTAAHCMDVPPELSKNQQNSHFALYGDLHRDKLVSTAIEDWIIHPNYNASGMINVKYDTALVRLASPLKESLFVKRAVFWSPLKALPTPAKGEMVGFGYIDTEGQLAKTLQSIPIEITRFDAFNYIEARSDTENKIACHGDSGGPLIFPYSMTDPQTNKTVTIPFVMGSLTRIFGARDISINQLTCPIPLDQEVHSLAAHNTVVEAFTNAPSMLEWISSVSGVSIANLTDPFSKLTSSSSDADGSWIKTMDGFGGVGEDVEVTGTNWRISGLAADSTFLNTNETEHLNIASIARTLVVERKGLSSYSASLHTQFSIVLLFSGILFSSLYL